MNKNISETDYSVNTINTKDGYDYIELGVGINKNIPATEYCKYNTN